MTEVRIDETLWRGAMAPEGVLLAWAQPDGAAVAQGAHVADVMIEGCRHQIMAPAAGRLTHDAQASCVLDPGAVIGRIERA